MHSTTVRVRIALGHPAWLFVTAVAAWWLLLPFVLDAVRPTPETVAERLATRQKWMWATPKRAHTHLRTLRGRNPEWDFMTRTFTVLALANTALGDPAQRRDNLATIDTIIADTLRSEAEHGQRYFLLPYVNRAPFRDPAARSLFVDGEIALMLAARASVESGAEIEAQLRERVDRIAEQMRRGPVLSGESYPDECWTFCNTTALAALAVADATLGTDHADLRRAWLHTARERLLDPATGMLVSSYTWDGRHLDGPEGSSLWMSAHNLLLVDSEMARQQFELGHVHLGRSFGGVAWTAEWPRSWRGPTDVDSGPVVPGLDASPGSSGLALIAARAFEDRALERGLLRALELAAFPIDDVTGRHYAAATVIGDAVVAYALSFGPLWSITAEHIR